MADCAGPDLLQPPGTLSSMKREDLLDLNDALQHPGRKMVFEISTDLTQEEDLDLLSPIVGTLEAESTGSILMLSGTFSTKLVLECSRCGHALEVVHEFDMEDDFPVEGIPSSWSHDSYAKVAPEDEPVPIFQENRLYRDRYVRQGFLVSLPLQPTCSKGWDEPCPFAEARGATKLKQEGHPAFGALGALKVSEDDAS